MVRKQHLRAQRSSCCGGELSRPNVAIAITPGDDKRAVRQRHHRGIEFIDCRSRVCDDLRTHRAVGFNDAETDIVVGTGFGGIGDDKASAVERRDGRGDFIHGRARVADDEFRAYFAARAREQLAVDAVEGRGAFSALAGRLPDDGQISRTQTGDGGRALIVGGEGIDGDIVAQGEVVGDLGRDRKAQLLAKSLPGDRIAAAVRLIDIVVAQCGGHYRADCRHRAGAHVQRDRVVLGVVKTDGEEI